MNRRGFFAAIGGAVAACFGLKVAKQRPRRWLRGGTLIRRKIRFGDGEKWPWKTVQGPHMTFPRLSKEELEHLSRPKPIVKALIKAGRLRQKT